MIYGTTLFKIKAAPSPLAGCIYEYQDRFAPVLSRCFEHVQQAHSHGKKTPDNPFQVRWTLAVASNDPRDGRSPPQCQVCSP